MGGDQGEEMTRWERTGTHVSTNLVLVNPPQHSEVANTDLH